MVEETDQLFNVNDTEDETEDETNDESDDENLNLKRIPILPTYKCEDGAMAYDSTIGVGVFIFVVDLLLHMCFLTWVCVCDIGVCFLACVVGRGRLLSILKCLRHFRFYIPLNNIKG